MNFFELGFSTPFEFTLAKLKEQGFKFASYDNEAGTSLRMDSKDLFLVISDIAHAPAHPYLDGKVIMENMECFDKMTKCPIVLPLCENEHEFRQLLKYIHWLPSKAGKEFSEGTIFNPITRYTT